jgi:hypothetical protein
MELQENNYRIPIDGRWDLEDLYKFPRAYEQVYYLIYSLLPHEDDYTNQRIQYAFMQYPWKGGYSAVNFYNNLKFTVPRNKRPQIRSIQYASPGWIDLILIEFIAKRLENIVKSFANSIKHVNSAYSEIHRGMQDRKLLRIETQLKELELEKAHAEYIAQSVQSMATILGFHNVAQMNAKTGSPLKTLKILLSLFRRVRILAEFENKGKTKFGSQKNTSVTERADE